RLPIASRIYTAILCKSTRSLIIWTPYLTTHITQIPKHNSDNAPLNMYSDDWDEISQKIRSGYDWHCQKCNIDLSAKADRKWLHVHHINGLKYDNNRENLKVLCIKCHSEEPSHAHIKNIPDYIDFLREKHQIQSMSD
ncbi:HNH endonuclease, partial [Nitrosomonas sp. Nm33]|uniref:HNH endonuclease n=1 Tax=Nitrosomonas sp. Nm33 TaxID=133724 RepID=UPI0008976440